ncbi:hypothetical protein ES706_00027 [subsurface metagenome]|nr:hypothetical protein [Hadesarchaea archaeon]
MPIGKEIWDKKKVWKVESIWYYDKGTWNSFTVTRIETLLTKTMRKMIREIRGDE